MISKFVRQVCGVIYDILVDEFLSVQKDEEDWRRLALGADEK